MTDWSLKNVLAELHNNVEQQLASTRKAFGHQVTKGDATEQVWLELLRSYLPKRYAAERAHIVDSEGRFSEQIDIAVFDRQYSPLVFTFQSQLVIPAESVYCVFEAKQVANVANVGYAIRKAASVRGLKRTSLPIPHAGGIAEARQPPHILAGLLSFESEWAPPLGGPLIQALTDAPAQGRLDIGCIAAHGYFLLAGRGFELRSSKSATTAFILELVARLQEMATVPMLDLRAYSRWLDN